MFFEKKKWFFRGEVHKCSLKKGSRYLRLNYIGFHSKRKIDN